MNFSEYRHLNNWDKQNLMNFGLFSQCNPTQQDIVNPYLQEVRETVEQAARETLNKIADEPHYQQIHNAFYDNLHNKADKVLQTVKEDLRDEIRIYQWLSLASAAAALGMGTYVYFKTK